MNVHNSICLVYAKFNGLSSMVPGYRFWVGPIALQCFVRISDKKNCNTKVVFNHFDRDSYIYNHYPIYNHIYICIIYIYTCVHTCMSTRYTFISHYAATTSLIIHDLSSSLIIRYLHIFFSIFFRLLLFFPATMSSSCNSVRKNATTPPTMHTFHS